MLRRTVRTRSRRLRALVSPTIRATEENFPVVIGFTVTDGDGDTATGSADGERQRRHADCEHGNGDDGAGRRRADSVPGQSGRYGRRCKREHGIWRGGRAVQCGRGWTAVDQLHQPEVATIFKDPVTGLAVKETSWTTHDRSRGDTTCTAPAPTMRTVVTLDGEADGSYTFTPSAPLVHPTAARRKKICRS